MHAHGRTDTQKVSLEHGRSVSLSRVTACAFINLSGPPPPGTADGDTLVHLDLEQPTTSFPWAKHPNLDPGAIDDTIEADSLPPLSALRRPSALRHATTATPGVSESSEP